jgi:lipoate-protein ligase A
MPRRKVHELLDGPLVQQRGVPVIRRFTGGGTVVVDRSTVFATLIMQVRLLARAVGINAQCSHSCRCCCGYLSAEEQLLRLHHTQQLLYRQPKP